MFNSFTLYNPQYNSNNNSNNKYQYNNNNNISSLTKSILTLAGYQYHSAVNNNSMTTNTNNSYYTKKSNNSEATFTPNNTAELSKDYTVHINTEKSILNSIQPIERKQRIIPSLESLKSPQEILLHNIPISPYKQPNNSDNDSASILSTDIELSKGSIGYSPPIQLVSPGNEVFDPNTIKFHLAANNSTTVKSPNNSVIPVFFPSGLKSPNTAELLISPINSEETAAVNFIDHTTLIESRDNNNTNNTDTVNTVIVSPIDSSNPPTNINSVSSIVDRVTITRDADADDERESVFNSTNPTINTTTISDDSTVLNTPQNIPYSNKNSTTTADSTDSNTDNNNSNKIKIPSRRGSFTERYLAALSDSINAVKSSISGSTGGNKVLGKQTGELVNYHESAIDTVIEAQAKFDPKIRKLNSTATDQEELPVVVTNMNSTNSEIKSMNSTPTNTITIEQKYNTK